MKEISLSFRGLKKDSYNKKLCEKKTRNDVYLFV